MNIILLAPKVAQNYIGQFPETTNNAYKYFNYDNRVVNERAETRFDHQAQFKGPEELTNQDYDTIVTYAKTLVNPILEKYSHSVACEDALMMAIRSYDRGIYDGKINASKYNVLLATMKEPVAIVNVGINTKIPSVKFDVLAKKHAPKEDAKRQRLTVKPKSITDTKIQRILERAPASQTRKTPKPVSLSKGLIIEKS